MAGDKLITGHCAPILAQGVQQLRGQQKVIERSNGLVMLSQLFDLNFWFPNIRPGIVQL